MKVKQEDEGFKGGNFVVNNLFKVTNSCSVLAKFTMDTAVLDIGNNDVNLLLSRLAESLFSVDTQDKCLRNVNTGQVIPYSIRWIDKVLF